ncbi:MAG TPA: hypothetical protein VE981_19035 [Planctomycetota bacterium]|nr:hypothetical protein [Planctomycetota bacterium]
MNITRSTLFAVTIGLLAFGTAPAQDEDSLLQKRRNGPGAPPADGRSDASSKYFELGQSVSCAYEETVEGKEVPIKATGGFVGVIEGVRKGMSGGGEGSKNRKARWDLTVEPRLTLDKLGTGKVSLQVRENGLSLDPDLKPESAARCGMDRAGARTALKEWERTLSKGEVQALEAGKILRWTLEAPFGDFRKLTRPRIELSIGIPLDKLRIGEVAVEVGMLDVRRHELQRKIVDLEGDLGRATGRMETSKKEREARRSVLAGEEAKLALLAQDLDRAFKDIRALAPDEAAKSKSCRDLEKKIAEAQERADRAMKRIVDFRELGLKTPPDSIDKLMEDYNHGVADAARFQTQLAETPEYRKFKQAQEALLKRGPGEKSELAKKDDAYDDQVKVCSHARSALERSTSAEESAVRLVEETRQELDRAKEALVEFKLLRPPYLTLVETDSMTNGSIYYRGSYWNPAAVLRILDLQINALQPLPDQIREKRSGAMAACWDALEACQNAQRDYSRAIDKSRAAQQLTEFGMFLFDSWDTGRNTGGFGIGVLMETAKKAVEWSIFGLPKPVEGSGTSLDAAELLKKSLVPRAFKTTVSGPAAKVAATSFLVSEAEKDFAMKCEEWFATRAWANFGADPSLNSIMPDAVANNPGTAALLAARVKAVIETGQALAEAEEDSLKAIKDGCLRIEGKPFKDAAKSFSEWLSGEAPLLPEGAANKWNFFKGSIVAKVMTKFFIGLAKDMAKSFAKQKIANYFENDAFLTCVEKDLIFTKCAALRYDIAVHLDQVEEMLGFFKNSRDEILRQYDPKNHFKVRADHEFPTSENLCVILQCDTETPRVLKEFDLEVRLGGILLERKADDYLQYFVPSGALKAMDHDASGKVKLEVRIVAR